MIVAPARTTSRCRVGCLPPCSPRLSASRCIRCRGSGGSWSIPGALCGGDGAGVHRRRLPRRSRTAVPWSGWRCGPEIETDHRPAAAAGPLEQGAEVQRRPRQPVEPGHDQNVGAAGVETGQAIGRPGRSTVGPIQHGATPKECERWRAYGGVSPRDGTAPRNSHHRPAAKGPGQVAHPRVTFFAQLSDEAPQRVPLRRLGRQMATLRWSAPHIHEYRLPTCRTTDDDLPLSTTLDAHAEGSIHLRTDTV